MTTTTDGDVTKVSRILTSVCDAFHIQPKSIGDKANEATLLPRQIAAYLLKTEGGQPLKDIRQMLNLAVDSQVYQYCARVKMLIERDAEVKKVMSAIKDALNGKTVDFSAEPPKQTRMRLPKPKPERRRGSGRSQAKKPVTQSATADHDRVVAAVRALAALILWKRCRQGVGDIAALLAESEDWVYAAIGKATVLVDDNPELEAALAAILSKLRTATLERA